MRLVVAAVGRLKDGAERELLGRYRDRFADLGKRLGLGPVVWHEPVESRAATPEKRRAEEGAALLKLARDADSIIALDERGKSLTSPVFAQHGEPATTTREGGQPGTGCPRLMFSVTAAS
jgi:23S rRNA (pseudouridine1915-N3)-methyltransferase